MHIVLRTICIGYPYDYKTRIGPSASCEPVKNCFGFEKCISIRDRTDDQLLEMVH